MRIGIVTPAYHRGAGLERVSVEYARGLRSRGHEVSVFTQTVTRETDDDGVRFVRVGGFKNKVALRAATFPVMATQALAGHKLDSIVAFGSSVTVPAVLRVPGCHRSWWEVANREWSATTSEGLRRRLNPHHRIVLWWDRKIVGGGVPLEVLAAGQWAADDIRRFYPAVADRVSILPDGVNLQEFSFDPDGRSRMRAAWDVGDEPVLFIVATELRRKGLGTLFEAFRLVREAARGSRLIVGGRVAPGDVRALAVQHRVTDGVQAIGFVEDLRAAYSAADVLVFPTRFDPWGLPIVEALACGTPVAASGRAGAASAVREGFSGAHISDPADPAVVAGGILRAMQLTPERPAIRASVAGLSWDRVVDDLESVLQRNA